MYVIHIEDHCHQPRYHRVNLDTLAELIPQVSDCRVEHVSASGHVHPQRVGVVFVSASSIPAAGAGVLKAVRRALTEAQDRSRAELHLPESGGRRGVCHGVIAVHPALPGP
ncbi:hypothetical protein [Streptomyces griseorubiginosus]|uniref:hypothetical protein n=1 Tax=Streptomyces griseorubiginosus TaxID=67304 RepID=UPI002E810B2F|nr:hypothetical protein [Streptomyces griseorubiginosus]WUB45517.1 hypothetical protein OHN19_20040 [Streptomyces griseorubiginosus]WUB54035.1 hypothetical protein OG942_20040 [Streptomyces griseorubiginosus]